MVTGILNGRQRFFLPALSPMLYNLAIIFGAVFLSGRWGVNGLAIGVVAGSALHALSTGAFRWEGFASYSDLWTQLVGSVLMGFGGVTAMGCTVGQGLTGLSTLALGSFLAVFGIVAGCVVTLKILVWQAQRED